MRKIYTSIDIGTDEIKAITVEEYNDKINVLATAETPTKGVKKGLIVDANLITNSIKKTIKILESKLGTKVEQIIAVVPSNNIDINITMGEVSVNTENNIIDGETIFNCLQKSLKGHVEKDMEVVSIMPIEYKINNEKKVKNPLGLVGEKLSSKQVVVSVPKKNVYSVVGILENLGIEVVDIVISSIADYYAIKNSEYNKEIIALNNIGKKKSVISVFNKGILIKEKIISQGGNSIDEAISFNFKTDDKQSKEIKEKYGVANRKYSDSDENYEITNRLDQKITINQYVLSEIIEFKLLEVLKNIKNEINNLTNREISYIMVTGAIDSMLGFNALIEDAYGRQGQILTINIIGIRDSKYSTSYGAIKYFIEKLNLREKEYTMMTEEKVEEMLKARKRMGTGSVLGKIFGRIFE